MITLFGIIFLIFYLLYKVIEKANTTEYKSETNLEYQKINDEISKGIPSYVEKIVVINSINNSDKIALLKIDNSYRIFIEIVDFRNDSKEIINLEEEIFFNKNLLYYYDKFALAIIFDSNSEGKIFSNIKQFEYLKDNTYYFNIETYKNGEKNTWNLKVNSDGSTIEKIFDKSYDKEDSESEFIFFDPLGFKEINLTSFFDSFFENDEFHYNVHCLGDAVSTCFLTNERKLGLWYFFKDEKIPRGNFSIFDVNDSFNPKLIFSYRLDEYGNFKFSYDKKKIIYWHYENNLGTLKSYHIREINSNSFANDLIILLEYEVENNYVINFELINDKIIEVFVDKFRIYNLLTKKSEIIHRNINSPYYCNSESLIYIYDYKLEKIKI